MEWLSNYWKRVVPFACFVAALFGAGLGQMKASTMAERSSDSETTDQVRVRTRAQVGIEFELPPARLNIAETVVSSDKAAVGSAAQIPAVVPGGVVEGNVVERMWETNAQQGWQVRATPLTPQNWYISGVVQRGAATQVIVQFDGDPTPKFYKIGEMLPGGSKLVWVRPDAIGVVTPNKKKINVPVLSSSTRHEQLPPGLPR